MDRILLYLIYIIHDIYFQVVTCSCMKSYILKGNEECTLKEENGLSNEQACYIKLPSNCSFVVNSTKYIGLQMSQEPCKGIYKDFVHILSDIFC